MYSGSETGLASPILLGLRRFFNLFKIVIFIFQALVERQTNDNEIVNLFNQLWLQIYRHVISYCCLLGVEYVGPMYQQLPESERFPVPENNEIGPHLNLLIKLMNLLVSAYQS